MKTIATINFKGGVGKTTVTWCLGETVSQIPGKHTLMFDLDAQMSLTQAVTFNEDGSPIRSFTDWQQRSIERKKTIFNALEQFTTPSEHFDFPIGYDFIYQISDTYHFVPAIEDLYWTELEVFERTMVKEFIRRLLAKIDNSKQLPKYDFVFFDCPPSFSLLSYSVLSCCDLVLIPINPDFYATKGLNLLLNSLRMRIEPFPVPKIGVFMNKAKKPGGASLRRYSQETERYLGDAKTVVQSAIMQQRLKAKVFDATIPDRVGIKRAVQEGIPFELKQPFRDLWQEIEEFLNDHK
ncbi:ParA family protein [candidate division KSB1 bacterium]|nr:ParA family protein [candidate division KSB1 bacterium]